MAAKKISEERHASQCSVCRHPQRDVIEEKFVDWVSQSQIIREHKLSRVALWRHAKATGLFIRRDSNIRTALSRFIERCSRVKPTAAALVAAVVAYSKIDSSGHTLERVENVGNTRNKLQELFSRMTRAEMLAYAERGQLPAWWTPETLP